ncbi:MAG: hypothetical protein OXF77_02580 [Thaumarchaeota archaeon]|nr:hypothetical protein [Nitrososphaerota archaeon]
MSEDVFIPPKPFDPPFKGEQYQEIINNPQNYFQHAEKIRIISNQQFLLQCKKQLKIPNANRGFKIIASRSPNVLEGYEEHYWNCAEDISPQLHNWVLSYHSEYIDSWIDDWKKQAIKDMHLAIGSWGIVDQEAIRIKQWLIRESERNNKNDTYHYVENKINSTIADILEQWNLSVRYDKAIRELLLFNQIIPADSKILLLRSWKNHNFPEILDGKIPTTPRDKNGSRVDYAYSIKFYPNETTKNELISFIRQMSKDAFRDNFLDYKPKVKVNPQIQKLKDIIIEKYNHYKALNSKQYATDQKIFAKIQDDFQSEYREYSDLSISAIRKHLQ